MQSKIKALDEKIAQLQRELHGGKKQARGAAKQVNASQVVVSGRKGRGALKEEILEVLAAAGPGGIGVREIAVHLGVKPANIHSWFSTNAKKISGLKKVGEARFALSGSAAAALAKKGDKAGKPAPAAGKAKTAKPAKAVKPAKAGKIGRTGKAAKPVAPKAAAKAAKATKAAKAPKVRAARGENLNREPAKRGELKNRIVAELKKAGEAGVTIKDLSAKTKTKYKNLYIWFVTTGKRIAGIEKVGPARYRLKAA